MNWRETLRKSEWFIVPVALVIGAFFAGSYYGKSRAWENIEAGADTVVKVVPIYKDFPQPAKTALSGYVSVPAYKFLTDTLTQEIAVFLHDTTVVYLPREQKYYEEADGKLRLWVSGYDPRLDRYELDLPTTTITNTVKEKASRWGITVNGGYGAALHEKNVFLSPYIGIGISYTILRL